MGWTNGVESHWHLKEKSRSIQSKFFSCLCARYWGVIYEVLFICQHTERLCFSYAVRCDLVVRYGPAIRDRSSKWFFSFQPSSHLELVHRLRAVIAMDVSSLDSLCDSCSDLRLPNSSFQQTWSVYKALQRFLRIKSLSFKVSLLL